MHFLHIFLFFLVVFTPHLAMGDNPFSHKNDAKSTSGRDCPQKIMKECAKELMDQGLMPNKPNYNENMAKCRTDKMQMQEM